MAVIKYQINGKADTKPIKNTEAAAEGMFKKISAIDNKLKAFVGVKVFSEVGKAVKNALTEYDKFQASLKGENSFTKQFDGINTAMSATLGTMRGELFKTIGDITGKDGFKYLEEAIPKIGATLIASFKMAAAIVSNIKENLQPELWNEFFSHANAVGSAFVSAFGNLLKDTLINALNVFKWGIKGLGIADGLWETMSNITKSILRAQMPMMSAVMRAETQRAMDAMDRQVAEEKERANVFPDLSLSEGTKTAMANLVAELGKAFEPLVKGLAGEDFSYGDEYAAALAAIQDIMDKMKAQEEKQTVEIHKLTEEIKTKVVYKLNDYFNTMGEKLSWSLVNAFSKNMNSNTGVFFGNLLGNIADLFGDFSAALNGIFNPLQLFSTLIGRLFDVFANISGPFAAFMNMFDVFFDAVEEICVVLGPALDAIFLPIVDIVRQLGLVFGMFLVMLKPVFEIVGLLANVIGSVLSPILRGLGLVFAALADGFAHVYNVVSGIVKGLTFGLVNLGSKDTDNVKRFNEAWKSEIDYDQYQNNSTSYSVAGDMYININFSHSYVNGDSREIAIMLRDEIRLAEQAGY
jgi:hypothetical protein